MEIRIVGLQLGFGNLTSVIFGWQLQFRRLVAVGGYVIGMGVTITATYILLSVLAAPALMELLGTALTRVNQARRLPLP